MEDESRPQFRNLSRDEIETILARNNVGRLGYERSGRVEVQPIHYVYSDGWIYGRTSYGAKYEALTKTAYRWWPVVFEVDEVEDLFNWRSVLVRGGFYLIDPDHAPNQQEDWDRAVELLRTLIPETLRDRDPVPFRTAIFRISMQEATGREAIPPAIDAPDPSA